MDLKLGDNTERVDKVAQETKAAFDQAAAYFAKIQKQIDVLNNVIIEMNATIIELQGKSAECSKECISSNHNISLEA